MPSSQAAIRQSQRLRDPNHTPRQLHFMPVSTPKTFHRFLDLPIEPQMQIWGHAAGKITPHIRRLVLFSKQDDPPGVRPSTKWYSNTSQKAIVSRRGHLMGTCRLARLFALEAWKKEVAKVNPDLADDWSQVKDLLERRLEEQIKEVKLRLNC